MKGETKSSRNGFQIQNTRDIPTFVIITGKQFYERSLSFIQFVLRFFFHKLLINVNSFQHGNPLNRPRPSFTVELSDFHFLTQEKKTAEYKIKGSDWDRGNVGQDDFCTAKIVYRTVICAREYAELSGVHGFTLCLWGNKITGGKAELLYRFLDPGKWISIYINILTSLNVKSSVIPLIINHINEKSFISY